jgi:peptidoglycan/xylan/chitin deacetylase (PgdA/CDA1 family)
MPSPWGADNTQRILDVLEDYGVKATFFVVGNWAEQYPDTAKAIVAAGHELENHSQAHDHFNALSAEAIVADVRACNETIAALTGAAPTLIRCPFGEYDDHVISAIRSMGMEPIQWDVEASAANGAGRRFARRARGGRMKKPDFMILVWRGDPKSAKI